MLAPAQRLDLALNTTDDGLHSFGSGIWMFHDHVEKAFTTNGMGEGGSISLIVYKDYLEENGTPGTHGMDLKPYFTKAFWERKIPVWQNYMDDWNSLGEPAGMRATAPAASAPGQPTTVSAAPASAEGNNPLGGLFSGLLLGMAAYGTYNWRAKLLGYFNPLISKFKAKP
jgi:hypothetical protein